MITSRRIPRTRNLILIGLLLSVVIHLIGGSLWPYGQRLLDRVAARLPQPKAPDVVTSDVVRLERRIVPRPATVAHPPPPQTHQPVQPEIPTFPTPQVLREQPKSSAPKPDVAHITLRAPKQVAKATGGESSYEHAAAPSKSNAAYSPEQIAQLEHQFSKVIADSRTDISTVGARTSSQPSTMHHYAMSFTGLHSGLHPGEGYIWPISPPRRIGSTVWYYAHYEYMYPDGTVEDDDIPWPYHFPVNQDLFALGVRQIPLQPPPEGYRPNRPLKPQMAQFFGGGDPEAGHQAAN